MRVWLTALLTVSMLGGQLPSFLGLPTVAATAAAAIPDVLYGVNAGDDGLSLLNQVTGAATFIGRLDPDTSKLTTPIALATRPSDRKLFAWNNTNGTTQADLVYTGDLVAIDSCTGLGTKVNTTNSQVTLGAIAFKATGELYGANSDLYSIDPATGVPTRIGASGRSNFGGLAFDPSGVLYGLEVTGSPQSLVTFNTSTGAATIVAALSTTLGIIGDLTFDPAGQLIGTASGSSGDVLFDINKATGAVSNIRTITGGSFPQGLAFAPPCKPADLSATITVLPTTGDVGSLMTFTGTVANGGPNAVDAAKLAVQLPQSLPFGTNWTTTKGTCSPLGRSFYGLAVDSISASVSQNTLICDMGTLASGASASVTVRARPLVAGSFRALAQVASAQADPDTTNNSAAVSFDVGGYQGVAQCSNGDGGTTLLPFARAELLTGMSVLYTTTADANATYYFPTLGKNTTFGVRYTSADGKTMCATTLTTNSDGLTVSGTGVPPFDRKNHTWTSAQYLDPITQIIEGTPAAGTVIKSGESDYLVRAGESDWYKVRIAPGQKVLIKLTGIGTTVSLPADFSLALFKDIRAYLNSTKTQVNADPLAAIQNHDAASTPDALSPDALSPDALSPDALSPDALSPDALSPDALSPDALSPDELSPDELSPDALSPDALSPDALSPDALSPDAYSGAQTATILRISAHEGGSPEQIIQNTWTNAGDFYIRVRGHNGAFDPSTAFQITAEVVWAACSGVDLSPATPALPSTVGTPKTVIVTNTARFRNADGTPVDAAAITAMTNGLNTFAARPEVSGVVVDLASNSGLDAAYTKWTNNPTCPAAANIVANGIKAVIDAYRASPALQYVVLAGGDYAVPYYRTPDQAGLGNEQGYQPGLYQDTPGEASLKFGYTLTQDPYATRYGIAHFDHTFYLPDLAIGRLVETPADIMSVITAYTDAGGVVHSGGGRAAVSGYDFLSDTATFIQSSLAPAMTVDPLIQLRGQTPWTADQMRSLVFARHYDIVSWNGHFSANTSLAADFATRIKSEEIAHYAALFKNTLVVSTGCHSGFNILDPEALLSTQNVDWAQAFARAGAQLIGGTGYQYGDTDFMKYTELLTGNFITELRYGAPGTAVEIGKALVNAKRSYVSGLPTLRGIDEKALMESTLYGLPMWKMDIGANGRLAPPSSSGLATTAFSGVSGLSTAPIAPSYVLNRHPLSGNPATGVYYDASGSIAVAPGAPVLPQTVAPIDAAGSTIPRGAVLLDAAYADETGITPFTDVANTELAGLHPGYSSQVFAPVRPFGINTLSGAATFVTTPAQFKSTGANSGVLRRWTSQSYQLFYSSRTDVVGALAGSPIVYGVTVSAGDSGAVHLDVTLGASTDPGIAAAFLTYTADAGSLYGAWHSIAMTPVAPDVTGTTGFGLVRHYVADVLPGTGAATDLRFFVQAVGGNGLVSMATNDGAYYRLTSGASATNPKTTTSIVLNNPPSSGTYLGRATVSATLSGPAGALAGLPVTLTVGRSRATAITDGTGKASATFTITTAPSATLVAAAFEEDATHIGSSTASPFTIDKATATLTPNQSLLQVGTSIVIATLGLGGTSDPQSVLVTLGTRSFWVQSDALGRIRLDALDLPLAFGPNGLKIEFAGNDRFTAASLLVTVTMYDPESKVTGGGWILTKASTISKTALVLGKKANFSFVAQYKNGVTAPVGNLEFSAKESKIELKATTFDYLAVNGNRGELQGKATINGLGSFSFRMIAVDTSTDTFEIRIWDGTTTFDAPLYQASNTTGGGNVVIH